MRIQHLNAKSTRRIARATGQDILCAWGHGTCTHSFVTPDHHHGWFNIKTEEWAWDGKARHVSACRGLFPDDFSQVPHLYVAAARYLRAWAVLVIIPFATWRLCAFHTVSDVAGIPVALGLAGVAGWFHRTMHKLAA